MKKMKIKQLVYNPHTLWIVQFNLGKVELLYEKW